MNADGHAEDWGPPVMMVLRGLGLGDLLTAVPALRALRRAHPRHRIVLAAPASLAGLVPLIDAVDELLDVSGPGPVRPGWSVPGPGRVPPGRRASGPEPNPPRWSVDVAVNLHGSGPQSIAALRRIRPGRLLTHAHADFPDVRGPSWRSDAHEVRRWCDLLGWYGIAADPADLVLDLSPSRGPARVIPDHPVPDHPVVIHPGAASPARRWPPERFALVAAAMRRVGHEVVVTGNAAERDLAEHVAALARLPRTCVLAGRTSLRELAVLIARARLVICGDTGVAHLATALATPSVVLFGPVSPALWGPSTGGPHAVLWAGRSGDPHGDRPDPGLLEVGVREVLNAAADLLEVSVP